MEAAGVAPRVLRGLGRLLGSSSAGRCLCPGALKTGRRQTSKRELEAPRPFAAFLKLITSRQSRGELRAYVHTYYTTMCTLVVEQDARKNEEKRPIESGQTSIIASSATSPSSWQYMESCEVRQSVLDTRRRREGDGTHPNLDTSLPASNRRFPTCEASQE